MNYETKQLIKEIIERGKYNTHVKINIDLMDRLPLGDVFK